METWQLAGTLTCSVCNLKYIKPEVFFPEGLSGMSFFIFLIPWLPRALLVYRRLLSAFYINTSLQWWPSPASSSILPPPLPAAAPIGAKQLPALTATAFVMPRPDRSRTCTRTGYWSSLHGGWDSYLDSSAGAMAVFADSHPWPGVFLATYSLPGPLKHEYIWSWPQKHGKPHSPDNQSTKENLKVLAFSTVLKTNNSYSRKTVILSEFPNLRKENIKA